MAALLKRQQQQQQQKAAGGAAGAAAAAQAVGASGQTTTTVQISGAGTTPAGITTAQLLAQAGFQVSLRLNTQFNQEDKLELIGPLCFYRYRQLLLLAASLK